MTRLLRAGTVSAVLALLFVHLAHASLGDRLPDFQRCIAECERENCGPDGPGIRMCFTINNDELFKYQLTNRYF